MFYHTFDPTWESPREKERPIPDVEAAHEDEPPPVLTEFVPSHVRARFVTRVYTLLACQLAVTAGVATGLAYGCPQWTSRNATPLLLGGIFLSLASLGVSSCIKTRHPWELLSLWLFTVAQGAALGAACLAHATEVLASLAATGILFGSLSILACANARPLRHPLWVGIPATLLLGAGGIAIAHALSGDPLHPWGGVISLVAIVAFSGFVLHDTSNLFYTYTPDDAVTATMHLYLDMLNIFVCFLTLFDGD